MNIIGKTRLWFFISGTLIVIGISALIFNGMTRGKVMNFGIDFTGGTMINLRFTQPVTVAQVRGILHGHKLGEAVIQRSGERDVLIRTEPLDAVIVQVLEQGEDPV